MSTKDPKPSADAPDNKAPAAAPAAEALAPAAVVAPAPSPTAETKTPAEWAAQLGHTKKRDRRLPQSLDHVDPAYAVADRLYGWSERAYHFQDAKDAFRITEATYREALKTAPQFPAVELTQAALTPEQAVVLAGHKPAENLKTKRAAEEAAAEAAKKGNG